MVFTMNRHNRNFGYVNWTARTFSLSPMRLYMKYSYNWLSGFEKSLKLSYYERPGSMVKQSP